jgi:methionyl aminopeptidase
MKDSPLQKMLEALAAFVIPGISTQTIDTHARELCTLYSVKPAFLDYKPPSFGGEKGFPAHCCVSINDEVIHGIPSETRTMELGDVVKIDMGIEKDGQFDDGAITVICHTLDNDPKSETYGKMQGTSAVARKLVKATQEALEAGCVQAKAGKTTHDIAAAVEAVAKKYDLHVIHGYGGHGIGEQLHMEPHVPNEVAGSAAPVELTSGMRIAIEPMFGTNHGFTFVAADGWTVKLRNGGLAAHFERTLTIK